MKTSCIGVVLAENSFAVNSIVVAVDCHAAECAFLRMCCCRDANADELV